MSRRCFYVEKVDPDDQYVILKGQTAHHVQSVLRLRSGDFLELRDGCGNGWTGTIVDKNKDTVRVRLSEQQLLQTESPLQLTLAMAFARTDRMELVIRQATELGIDRFVAYRSKRSQYGLSDAQVETRRQRWLKIAREAMCQCGRMKVPEINIVPDLLKFIAATPDVEKEGKPLRLLASEGEQQRSLADVWRSFPECAEVLAVIGPEGGWSAEEMQELLAADFHAVHLGPRILRLETAAVAFVALTQILWGDFRSRA